MYHPYTLQALKAQGADAEDASAPSPPLPDMLHQYGRRYLGLGNSSAALQYWMLSAAAGGGGLEAKARVFRELLVESKDYGGCINIF